MAVTAKFRVNAQNYNKKACTDFMKIKSNKDFYDENAAGEGPGVKIEMNRLSDIPKISEIKREIANTLGVTKDTFSIVSYCQQKGCKWKNFRESDANMVTSGFAGSAITQDERAWAEY